MKKALLTCGRQDMVTDILLLRDKSCGRATGEAVGIAPTQIITGSNSKVPAAGKMIGISPRPWGVCLLSLQIHAIENVILLNEHRLVTSSRKFRDVP